MKKQADFQQIRTGHRTLDAICYPRSIPAQDELNLDEVDSKNLLKLLDKYPPYVSKILLSLNGIKAFDFGAA